jgi:hypothetical protein
MENRRGWMRCAVSSPASFFNQTKERNINMIAVEQLPRRANLILHCGANAVARTRVAGVSTPKPTPTWSPIPHSVLIEQVEVALHANALHVVGQAHSLTHDGSRYFGLIEIRNGAVHPDYTWVLGLRNSHDKSFPAGLVAGGSVFVCDNLSFSGEIKITRRHTRFILLDLPRLIGGAVERLIGEFRHQDQRIAAYKGKTVTDRSAHDLIIRSTDVGACTNRQIPAVLKWWREPKHDEFAPRNAWSLFNSFTEVQKGNLTELPNRTEALHRLLDSYVGVN